MGSDELKQQTRTRDPKTGQMLLGTKGGVRSHIRLKVLNSSDEIRPDPRAAHERDHHRYARRRIGSGMAAAESDAVLVEFGNPICLC